MIANLNKIEFDSRFFAKFICREQAIEGLRDGTLYLLTENREEWNDAVLKVQESIKQSRARALWHLPYSIEALTDLSLLKNDEKLLEYMKNADPEYNLIMPLYTPDRTYKCYFIGRVGEIGRLEAYSKILIDDAQKVSDECSFAAFATSVEITPDKAKQLWMKLIDYNSCNLLPAGGHTSSRGKYNKSVPEYAFLGKGFEKMIDIPKIEYSDLICSLQKFPDTIEAISKSADNNSYDEQMEYVKICHSLSAIDKNELILELSKRINDKNVLAEAIDAVINKAKSSRLKVRLAAKATTGKIDGRRIYGDWCTYLVDDKGNMQWLDFEPAAHVIYILNLINRINNPDTLSVLDISKQEEAFVAVYNAIYVDGGSEHYKRLIRNVEKSNGQGYERKRLKDCYKIIANCVNVQCSFFNESPSPYVVSLERPLTIDPSLIEISDKFKNLNSIKWLFAKK